MTIQIPPVLKSLNFGEHLVKQIRERNLLTSSELQESLDALAFDINENDLIKSKKIGDPVRYFMSIANKKMRYAPSGNYISDELKALEENKKRLEILKQRKQELEKVNAELEYEEWLVSLSEEEKIKLVPEDSLLKVGNQFHNQLLRAHFDKTLQNGFSFSDPILLRNLMW